MHGFVYICTCVCVCVGIYTCVRACLRNLIYVADPTIYVDVRTCVCFCVCMRVRVSGSCSGCAWEVEKVRGGAGELIML